MTAKAALLQALVVGPGYGLQLIERVKLRSNGCVQLGQGSIYPALRALQREGLVRSFAGRPVPARAGGRPRIFYELTADGLQIVQQHRRVVAALFRVAEPLGF